MSESITAEPSESYDGLKKQFLALRRLANSQQKQIATLKEKDYQEARSLSLAGSSEIQAQRDNNEALTEALLLCEAQRDALKAEVEDLKHDIGRYIQQASALAEEVERLRARLAASVAFVKATPTDPDITAEQSKAYIALIESGALTTEGNDNA